MMGIGMIHSLTYVDLKNVTITMVIRLDEMKDEIMSWVWVIYIYKKGIIPVIE
jgi:hypothetical protein